MRYFHPALLLLALATTLRAGDIPRPNILIILADDMGFSDAACYGGEIETPNLDALAKGGLRFTQFYNTARCWPSRAAILTGYYAQQVRRDAVPDIKSGVAGTRPKWAKLLPEHLRPLGYRSYHSGKWHVDGDPLQNGFDHSYSLNDHDRYFAPRLHSEDDIPLPAVVAGTGFYATTAIADHALKCLKEHAEKHATKPFFQFLAFTAPHFPVQAPAEDIARYRGRYLRGWDALREERWRRMQEMGIGGSRLSEVEREVGPPYAFPKAMAALGSNEVNRPLPWSTLNASQRKFQADKMAVHAAMVDRMDREIGRVLAQIREMGAMDNTLVLFLSDNGASAEMMVRGDGHDPEAECGTGATFLSIGPGWSSMANTPFRRHKTWVHEGGISTPLIVHWPRGIAARGELRQTPGHLIDLVPTLLELAGGKPLEKWEGQPIPPPPGKSLVPLFAQDGRVAHDSFWWLHEDNRALRAGKWKIVAAGKDQPWELYDLDADRSESKNLAMAMPAKVQELANVWTRQTADHFALARKDLASVYQGWRHSGSVFILTTPEGANLPAEATVEGFPLLVRLHKDWFDFTQTKARGEDVRFSSSAGSPLAYQIEQWDAANGTASIWVRVPRIKGQERQELNMHWGNSDATNESSGSAVFNESNGYLSVWHMNGPVKDEVGSLESKDVGTTATTGRIGEARHLAGGHGIFGGETISNYPVGASPHSSEMWLRAEKSNGRALAWGNEHGQGKVVMHFQSPPHVKMECYFSGADVSTAGRLPMHEWIQVVHTYQRGDSRVYVNGALSGVSAKPNAPLAIKSPARLWIGGWYHHYDFIGDIDEVRVSKVVRSADWVKLQYENQKSHQTLVGPVVKPGSTFAVAPAQAAVPEGTSATFTAQADGARKVYWILREDGRETVAEVDRMTFTFSAGRVTGDKSVMLQCKAIYPTGTKTKDIPIAIKETIPDPAFALRAPAIWDGRTTIEIVPYSTGLFPMPASNGEALKTEWIVGPFAVIQEIEQPKAGVTHQVHKDVPGPSVPGKLILKRAQNSGQLTVTAKISNGGTPVTQSVTIDVKEPERDAWRVRAPGKLEKPEDGQFYARDDRNEGTLHYNGTLDAPAEASQGPASVFLKLYADDQLVKTEHVKPGKDLSYAFTMKLKPGLIRYKVEFGTSLGGRETVRHTATNLVCGDAYIINGQSNALATDTGEKSPPETHEWIRSYGRPPESQEAAPGNLWCHPVWKAEKGEKAELGWWGMELAKRLVESQRIPIFILNAAVGGTRIDQHQRNPNNSTDLETIYGRMLWRVQHAKLTHGIRAILWHQGENDQGADGPTGGFGWETYHPFFVEMAAAWKQDFPNVQHYYVFQIWPDSCSMGGRNGSGDMLREKQRTLPDLFSNMSILSTLGVRPPGGCHFPLSGWSEFARLIQPVLERDHYGRVTATSVTAPNLRKAFFISGAKDAIALEFDQPVVWQETLAGQFYLDGEKDKVASGSVTGNVLTLKTKAPSSAAKITYLKEIAWNQDTLLHGANGLAALTFCNVPIQSGGSSR